MANLFPSGARVRDLTDDMGGRTGVVQASPPNLWNTLRIVVWDHTKSSGTIHVSRLQRVDKVARQVAVQGVVTAGATMIALPACTVVILKCAGIL